MGSMGVAVVAEGDGGELPSDSIAPPAVEQRAKATGLCGVLCLSALHHGLCEIGPQAQ